MAIGNDAGGTKVWPIAVQRTKVSLTHVALEGQVLDAQGDPIANATVERSPEPLLSRRVVGARHGTGPLEGHPHDRRLTRIGIQVDSQG